MPSVKSGRVGPSHLFDVSGRVFWVEVGFGSKFMAHTCPVNYCEPKITTRTHPLHWLGRVRLGFFGQVGLVDPGGP
jgi:hypothetical protein